MHPDTHSQPAQQPRMITWLQRGAVICLAVLALVTGYLVYLSYGALNTAPTNETAAQPFAEHGSALDPPRPVADFSLPSQDGTPLSLSTTRGKYVLLFFGYTHCPDVCPTTLSDFVQVKRGLGAAASEVRFMFISVDGARDTPAVLARYMQNFDASFIGLQGDDATLDRIGKDYGLYYKREKVAGTSEPYLVSHSSSIYMLDRAGRLSMVYGFGIAPKVIVEDIGTFLAKD